MLNFPTAPKIDDVFEDPLSGAAWVWAGTKWWRTKAATYPEPPPPLVTRLAPNNAPGWSPMASRRPSPN